MTDRFPPIPAELWTAEQRRYAQPLIDSPRGAVIGPFVPLMRSPELMDHVQRVGEYLRYRSTIGQRLSELAILVTARHWTQQVEWAIHAPIALKAGIDASVVDAIAQGRRPDTMSEEEAAVYDVSIELHASRQLSDACFERATRVLGEQGVIDLFGINGYYALLAMVMNGARTAAPASTAAALAELVQLTTPRESRVMTGHIAAKLAELGLTLPTLAKPKGTYLPFRRHGDLVFLAGQTSSRDGQPVFTGPVGAEVSVEQGYAAARLCGLNLLAALSAACDGDLDRVSGCVKVNGYVFAPPGFERVPAVINGASDLIVEVFGEAGRHARTAIGVATLPGSASVEVEAVFAIRASGAAPAAEPRAQPR